MMERQQIDLEVPMDDGTPHRRAGEQRLEILTNSPLAKVLIWIVNAVFLPVVAWTMITVLAELRQLNDAIAKNNTIVALYDLRLTTIEHAQVDQGTALKGLDKTSTEYGIRINNLERDQKR